MFRVNLGGYFEFWVATVFTILFSALLIQNHHDSDSNLVQKELPPSILIYDSLKCLNGVNSVVGAHYFDMYGRLISKKDAALCVHYSENEFVGKDLLNGGVSYFNKEVVVWNFPVYLHHDIQINSKGHICFLTEEIDPAFKRQEPIIDMLVTIDQKGTILKKQSFGVLISQLDSFLPLKRDSIVQNNMNFRDKGGFPKSKYDSSYFHINSIQFIPETPLSNTSQAFKKGNILVSDFKNNFIAIIDPENFKILWFFFQKESIMGQHSARMLPNGSIMFFLNNIPHPKLKDKFYSAVRKLNPITKEVVWEFDGEEQYTMHSLSQGHCQQLDNGNILITVNNFVVGENPYVLEVTPQKEVVWKWEPAEFPESNLSQRERFYRVERIPYN
jgi:hypothetical protein